jgi:hypothetical protein
LKLKHQIYGIGMSAGCLCEWAGIWEGVLWPRGMPGGWKGWKRWEFVKRISKLTGVLSSPWGF